MKTEGLGGEPGSSVFLEAANWLIELREDGLGADERARFNAWLRKSPENLHAYMEAAAVWDDIPKLASGMQVDVDAVVAYARTHGNVSQIGPDVRPRSAAPAAASSRAYSPLLRPSLYSLAFAMIICASTLLVWLIVNPGSVYATAIGEQRTISLSDGSTIHLGARSKVRVQFSSNKRRVHLIVGQAGFSVAKDASRPFVVSTNRTQVRAIGTQFNVHRMRSGTIVRVIEGRVALFPDPLVLSVADSVASASEGDPAPEQPPATAAPTPDPGIGRDRSTSASPARELMILSAGQEITLPTHEFASDGHVLNARAIVRAEETLTFVDVPIIDAIDEFNRYNQRQIEVADATLASLESLRISGVFSARKPESLLRYLSEQMGLNVKSTETGYRVR